MLNDETADMLALHHWEDKQHVMFLIVEYHTHLANATSEV